MEALISILVVALVSWISFAALAVRPKAEVLRASN